MASNDGKIRMMVKNAAQAKDFPLDLATTASVGDLKAELQRSYPGQPRPAQQKLIFAGRLLTDDSQSLAQLITSSKYDVNTPQAVHLVLPPPSLHSSSSGLPSSPPLNRNFVQPDLRRSAPAGLGVPMPGTAQPHPRFVPGNGVPPPFARPQPVPFVPAPAVPAPAPAVAPAAAGGGGLLGRQNWSLLVKLVIILYILAQGGGSWRLSILTLGAFLVYLYQVGLFPRLNRRAAPQPAPAAAPAQAQAAAPERVEAEQQGEGGAEAQQQQDAGVPPTAQATQPAARTGVWREVENLFLPLLYSLIPTWQPEAVVQPVPLPGGQPPQMHNHPHQE